MSNDVTWWKRSDDNDNSYQSDQREGVEIPGDTDAADIVGRTGEEMPEVAHDTGGRMDPDELADFEEDVVQGDTRKPSRLSPGGIPAPD
jgi:hypothetical protein